MLLSLMCWPGDPEQGGDQPAVLQDFGQLASALAQDGADARIDRVTGDHVDDFDRGVALGADPV